jgi:DNA-binding LytR/AlgR family response regulator
MSITVLLADDEALVRRDLAATLREIWPGVEILEAENGLEALDILAARKPQAAFLDIRMPGANGLEVARAASGTCHVVFCTAYDEYAVEAFTTRAVDYLLKPVSAERMGEAVARLKERLLPVAQTPADLTQLLAQLSRAAPNRATLRWVSANVGDTIKMFGIDEILYFHSEDKYTKVVTADDEAHIRKTLKELSDELDSEVWWQVHRSTIVRADAIAKAHRDELGKITLALKQRADKIAVSQAFNYRFRGM